jgi:hypothetical protein
MTDIFFATHILDRADVARAAKSACTTGRYFPFGRDSGGTSPLAR